MSPWWWRAPFVAKTVLLEAASSCSVLCLQGQRLQITSCRYAPQHGALQKNYVLEGEKEYDARHLQKLMNTGEVCQYYDRLCCAKHVAAAAAGQTVMLHQDQSRFAA